MKRLLLLCCALALPPAAAQSPLYVAMGSSYAAGPGTGPLVPGAPSQCSQSTVNYAHQLAAQRHLTLIDRSCSGATTRDILQKGQFGLPAQIDAVTAATKLVTVTIGGNDVGFVGGLASFTCVDAHGRMGGMFNRSCPTPPAPDEKTWSTLKQNLTSIAQIVHQRAPSARLVFVDYITLLPADGQPCDDLPLTPAHIAQMQIIAQRLAQLTAAVAQANGAQIFKASELTKDHGVCSANPWVNGIPALAAQKNIVPFHPKREAMDAIAKALEVY